jgi:hypothetical protein
MRVPLAGLADAIAHQLGDLCVDQLRVCALCAFTAGIHDRDLSVSDGITQ